MGVDNPLGKPRGPTGVHDVEGVVRQYFDVGRLFVAGRLFQGVVVSVAGLRPVDEQETIVLDSGQLTLDRIHPRHKIRRGDQHHRVGVLQQAGYCLLPQQNAQGHCHSSDFTARPVDLQLLQTVGQKCRDLVAFFYTQGQHGIGQLIDPFVERLIGQSLIAKHGRKARGAITGMPTENVTHIHHALLTKNKDDCDAYFSGFIWVPPG